MDFNAPFKTPIPELFSVEGLVAVITGGGTGLGLMMATALESNGAVVYIVGRRLDVLNEAVRKHNKRGNLHALAGDVNSTESMQAVVATIQAKHGYTNLLVNNAAISKNLNPRPLALKPDSPAPDDLTPHPGILTLQSQLLGAGTRAEWMQTFDTNLAGPYYTTLAFLPLLEAGNRSPWGRRGVTSQVMFMSSVTAYRRDPGMFTYSYALSKAALVHLAKCFTNLLAGWQIRSNVLLPGVYPSDMTKDLFEGGWASQSAPLQRPGDEEDMGGLILFLASRAGAYINGSAQITDGGRLSMFSSSF